MAAFPDLPITLDGTGGDENIDSLLSTINTLFQTDPTEQFISHSTAEQDNPNSDGYDVHSLASLEAAGFNEPQISEITLGLEAGLDVSVYAKPEYTWRQMQELRFGLMMGISTNLYENPYFSAAQMREIRLGLFNHVDASFYANLMLAAADMHKIRMDLTAVAYRLKPFGYGYRFTDEESGMILRISDDCMNAYILLPEGVEGRFSVPRIHKILQRHEIIFGLLEPEIERFSKELPHGMEIKIAHGMRSEKGTDGYYDIFFNKSFSEPPKINEDGTVDYSNIRVAESVKTDQLLATYHPATAGKSGSTVNGIALTENPGQDLPPLTGEGFRFDPSDNSYKAVYAGNISYKEDTYSLNVWKVFTIDGDATRYSGSTEYDGTVLVTGDVRNMAHIKATGDIIVNGTVEGADLYSGHNILIRGGVNAAGKGSIEAVGKITANFFESANLKSGGTIEGNYFLSCQIDTDDKILAKGGKSLIQGGRLNAALGIEAFSFRASGGAKTILEVGRTTELSIRKQELVKQITQITNEIRKLRDGKAKLLEFFGEDRAETYPIYQRTCIALEQKEEAQAKLDLEINRIEVIIQRTLNAYIKSTGTIQAGILVIICGTKKMLERNLYGTVLNAQTFITEETDNGT